MQAPKLTYEIGVRFSAEVDDESTQEARFREETLTLGDFQRNAISESSQARVELVGDL